MPSKPKVFVLDSWAIMAYFEDEPSGRQVADLIVHAHENGIPLFISVINAGEVWYILAREISAEAANQGIIDLHNLGIVFVDSNWQLTQEAARFKSKNKMSYADCFVAALVKENKAELITGDREFKQVESEIKIHWV